MMVLYKLYNADGYETLYPCDNKRYFENPVEARGRPIVDGYVPIQVRLIRKDEHGRKVMPGDNPFFDASNICVSERAVIVLGWLLKRFGELLPLECDDGKYYLYNVTTVLDCIDWSASKVIRYSTGRVMGVSEYKFLADRIVAPAIFLAKGDEHEGVFVTPDVVEAVEKAGLRGFRFVRITEGSLVSRVSDAMRRTEFK